MSFLANKMLMGIIAIVAGIIVLSISEMGHFLNRTLWHNQVALISSLRPWL